jgi:hypothetical protein
LHSSSSSYIVFVIAKLLLRGGASSTHCALATELCDWNHTREVAIAQEVLKPVACGKASSPTQPPPHRMQRHPTKCPFGGKILEACICMQGGFQTMKMHFKAQMDMQEWRVVISGPEKEDCY